MIKIIRLLVVVGAIACVAKVGDRADARINATSRIVAARSDVVQLLGSRSSNRLGNPIYRLKVGNKYFKAVSGTAKSQRRDRHRGGNYAPLPDGRYRIGEIYRTDKPDIGGTFVHVEPMFKTQRTELGIHLDPSYNLTNGRDGTAGCVGLTTVAEWRELVKLLRQRPRLQVLEVKIAR